MFSIDMIATGIKIKSLIKSKGISVKYLMNIMGIKDKSNIYKWYRGETLPSIENLLGLSSILGMSVNEILVFEKYNI